MDLIRFATKNIHGPKFVAAIAGREEIEQVAVTGKKRVAVGLPGAGQLQSQVGAAAGIPGVVTGRLIQARQVEVGDLSVFFGGVAGFNPGHHAAVVRERELSCRFLADNILR